MSIVFKTTLVLSVVFLRGDLPVHCELDDYIGQWEFFYSEVNDPDFVPSPLSANIGTRPFCRAMPPTSASQMLKLWPSELNDVSDKATLMRLSEQNSPKFLNDKRSDEELSTLIPKWKDSFKIRLTDTKRKTTLQTGGEDGTSPMALSAVTGDEQGSWTPIYDEGFEVRVKGMSFFAFSRFKCLPGVSESQCLNNDNDAHEDEQGTVKQWQSLCGQTFMGWYHAVDTDGTPTGYGCWFGRKVNSKEAKLVQPATGIPARSTEDQIQDILRGQKSMAAKNENRVKDTTDIKSDVSTPPGPDIEALADQISDELLRAGRPSSPLKTSEEDVVSYFARQNEFPEWYTRHFALLQQKNEGRKFSFRNKDSRRSLALQVQKDLGNMWPTSDDIVRAYVGGVSKKRNTTLIELSNNRHLQLSERRTKMIQNMHRLGDTESAACNSDRELSPDQLPNDFDWREQYGNSWNSPILVQGDCGSCFAIASVYMIQSRVNIELLKHGVLHPEPGSFTEKPSKNDISATIESLIEQQKKQKPIRLSAESVVSCSFYNQGCNGGLELLVSRHVKEVGLPEESCFPYTSRTSFEGKEDQCSEFNHCFQNPEKNLWYVKDYAYIGGFYGECSERKIMSELMKNGPLTVALNVADSRMGQPVLRSSTTEHLTPRDVATVSIEITSNNLEKLFDKIYSNKEISSMLDKKQKNHDKLYLADPKDLKVLLKKVRDLADEQDIEVSFGDATPIGIHGWEYVDHSVALIGWGEEASGEKFWIIRNSWADDVAGGGYVKVRRGNNLAGVESAATWASIDLCRGKMRTMIESSGGDMNVICPQM